MNPTGKTNTGALWVRLTALACFTYNLIELYYNNNKGVVSKREKKSNNMIRGNKEGQRYELGGKRTNWRQQ